MRVAETPQAHPRAIIPLVEFPAEDCLLDALLAEATPHAVLEQQAYVYLLRVVTNPLGVEPSEKMPLVEFPTADPEDDPALEAATPDAVDVQEA